MSLLHRIPATRADMASPSKRLCLHAARTIPRCHQSNSSSHSPFSTLQCRRDHPLTHLPTTSRRILQRRAYHPTCRHLADNPTPSSSRDEPEDDDPVAEYTIDESEISSLGHAELQQHREVRAMVRLAAWSMPLLSRLAKPFEPPDQTTQPLRWRYTTYMGDAHPASQKVVVEFSIDDLAELNDRQRAKLTKLAGARFNPETRRIRMSCESFETQAMNKRYLGDVIGKLMAEAKDLETDSFEDVPLDTRHYKVKKRLRFPEAWKMTKERREQLEGTRRKMELEEGKRVERKQIVSGIAAIEAARQIEAQQLIEEPVLVGVRATQGGGKGGKQDSKNARR